MCIYARACVCDRDVCACVCEHLRVCMGMVVCDGMCVYCANVSVCACIVYICDTVHFYLILCKCYTGFLERHMCVLIRRCAY